MSAMLQNHEGFTLVELIVVLIIASIMGVMMVSFSQTAGRDSINPLLLIHNKNNLQKEMEVITQEYKRRLDNGTLNLATFKSEFIDGRPLVVSSETGFISLLSGDKPVLMVTVLVSSEIGSGNQKTWSIFSD